MSNSQGSGRKPAPAPVKIHRFEKRAPRSKDEPGRDEEAFAGAHPTVPELAFAPPRMGGAAAPKAEPASDTKGRAARKSRSAQGGSPSSWEKAPLEEESPPSAVTERLSTAQRLVAEGKPEEARAVLERLVTLGVATAPVHTQLGAIYLAQGATERALERFEEALALEPEELGARLYRAEARLARGDLLKAQQDLQHVLDEGTAGSPLVQRAQQLLQTVEKERDRKRR
jgi:predicted Zn-dependent protease